jgi:sortase A
LFRELGLALVAAGVVVLLFVAYELVGTNFTEEHNQAALAQQFNKQVSHPPSVSVPATPADPTTSTTGSSPAKDRPGRSHTKAAPPAVAPTKNGAHAVIDGVPLPLPPPGGALDHLVIPAIGVDRYVVQGVAENDLQEGPGHYLGTPLPGQKGNVGIAGHRTTFGAPFFLLNEVVPGDLIYLTDTSGTTWVYSVEREWVVAPTDVAVLDPSGHYELTLTTCNPRFDATSRLVVRALLASRLARGTKFAGHLPVTLSAAHLKAPGSVGHPHGAKPTSSSSTSTSSSSTSTSASSSSTSSSSTSSTSTSVPAPAAGAGGPGSGDNPTVGPAGGETEALVSGGYSTWLALAGWALLALALWVVTRALASRKYRLTKAMVIVAGALVCLVPLWFTFENAVNLLPANL